MGLLEKLGLDPEDFKWQDLALCEGYEIDGPSADIFFDAYESDYRVRPQADRMCMSCPVMKQCFRAGEAGEWGLWGGVYWSAGEIDENRNDHKTEEDWERLWERVR